MSRSAQLALALPHRPALGREDYLVGSSNAEAVGWLDRWPEWPASALVLYGPPATGKTHLCRVWQAVSGAIAVDAGDLAVRSPPDLIGDARAIAIDDLDFALADRPERQRAVLHLYNMVVARSGSLLLTGGTAPGRWQVGVADLRSRLLAALAIGLSEPDDDLIAGVLAKLFADRQLPIGAGVIRFLLPRMERSFAAARDIVAAIDRESLADRRQITVAFVSEVLARRGQANETER